MQNGDTLWVPSADYRVFVLGSVTNQGRYPIPMKARLTDALALAGGLTPTADHEAATILRGQEKLGVDLKRVLNEKDSAANLALEDGDTDRREANGRDRGTG